MPALKPLRYAVAHVSPDCHPYSPRIPEEEPVAGTPYLTLSQRRRTQIRLAQRAYRNRKENAITELEAQVRDLKEANSAMRSAVQQVFESSANNPHILAQAPELGIHQAHAYGWRTLDHIYP